MATNTGSTPMMLPTLQLPLDGIANEIGAFFAVIQNAVHSGKRAGRESGGHLFGVDLFAAQSDITY